MIKVSVVVPTYCSGAGLARVMESLDAQTMPSREFEVIFVDDGSPDDTVERLEIIRAQHENVRIQRIEHSGWPSRPRNIGLELAKGEYILFMDHDDALYPHALQAGYDHASKNGADVLNGKETRTDQPKWAVDVYTQNMNNAIGRQDVHPILPTNPHKLFRREFLLQHHIRFPEGRRILWEDVFFNVDVFRYAKVISVLSDTPFYHWVRHGETASSSYAANPHEYWSWLHRIFEYIASQLAGTSQAGAREQLILNQYRTRVLPAIGPDFFSRPDEDVARSLEYITRILTEHVPEAFDALVPKALRARAYLMRRGQIDLLRLLASVDPGTVGLSSTTDVAWVEGKLTVTSSARWTCDDGRPLSLVAREGKILRNLPAELVDALPDDLVDVTDEVLGARSTIGVRSRRDKVTWMLPTHSEVRVDGGEGDSVEVRIVARTTLNIDDAVFSRALESVVWDFTAQNELFGIVNQRALRTGTAGRVALVQGRSAIAYASNGGMLSLDIGQNSRSVINSSAPGLGDAIVTRKPGYRSKAIIPLARVAVTGETTLVGEIHSGANPPTPARIIGDGTGARVEFTVRAGPGRHRITARFEGRDVLTTIVAEVSRSGKVRFSKA